MFRSLPGVLAAVILFGAAIGAGVALVEAGVELVHDVAPYEMAKLRMLNGAHSALAYIGLARGHVFVHQAVADPAIRPVVERLMREEAAPSLDAAPGQDLNAYADALLDRFTNPALNHRLAQIAMDGSQKIPQRWLETLAFHSAQGRQCPAILTALVVSGLPPYPFSFLGFAPPKKGKRATFYAGLRELRHTLVLFEAPHRLVESLGALREALGDRPAAVGRELTKLHEEVLRGRLSELAATLGARPGIKGEIVVVVDNRTEP